MACRRWRPGLCAVAIPIILATAGCSGDDLQRQPVAGFVYLDDRPLSDGLIIFYPVENSKFAIVTNGGAMIKNGYFSIPRVGRSRSRRILRVDQLTRAGQPAPRRVEGTRERQGCRERSDSGQVQQRYCPPTRAQRPCHQGGDIPS